MSCLSKQYRLNTQNLGSKKKLEKEFNQIYKNNKKWHTSSFVVFFKKSDTLSIAFVSSKKIGNAVKRNRARRVLRALVLEHQQSFCNGSFIFVAKKDILNTMHKKLQKDFKYAIRKIGL